MLTERQICDTSLPKERAIRVHSWLIKSLKQLQEKREVMAKVLIVDDEKSLAEMLKDVIELEGGHQVKIVLDGEESIKEAGVTHYDLILMDIRLPGINGVEAFLKIKEIDPQVKVIMMTGLSVEGLIEEALKEGAYACLHKPFDSERVVSLIEEALLTG